VLSQNEGRALIEAAPSLSPKPRLSAEQLAQFARIVEAGSDREKDGVVRWRIERHRREVRGRLSSALCREAVEETRLLPYQCAAPSSGSAREDRRGFQKRMARPVCKIVLPRLPADQSAPTCPALSVQAALSPTGPSGVSRSAT
jgi:hypothetical protein